VAFPLLGIYSATKGAVVRMTEAMALQLRDHGVRANAICPGFVDTDMVQRSAMDFTAVTGMPFDELVSKGQGGSQDLTRSRASRSISPPTRRRSSTAPPSPSMGNEPSSGVRFQEARRAIHAAT